MPSFLEERLPVDVRLGMSYADDYTVMITTTAGGAEYRKLVQPFPARSFHVNFTTDQADLGARHLPLSPRLRKIRRVSREMYGRLQHEQSHRCADAT